MDRLLLFPMLYKGRPREIFLMEGKSKKIFENELAFENAKRIKDYIARYVDLDKVDEKNEGNLNALIYAYCLNISEMKGITGKSDKMFVISEMSRSLFYGCLLTVFVNIAFILLQMGNIIFFYIESVILVGIACLFLDRKRRYERYGIRILIRTFLIHVQEEK